MAHAHALHQPSAGGAARATATGGATPGPAIPRPPPDRPSLDRAPSWMSTRKPPAQTKDRNTLTHDTWYANCGPEFPEQQKREKVWGGEGGLVPNGNPRINPDSKSGPPCTPHSAPPKRDCHCAQRTFPTHSGAEYKVSAPATPAAPLAGRRGHPQNPTTWGLLPDRGLSRDRLPQPTKWCQSRTNRTEAIRGLQPALPFCAPGGTAPYIQAAAATEKNVADQHVKRGGGGQGAWVSHRPQCSKD